MDDEEMNCTLVADMLEFLGHSMIAVRDGEEAIRLYKEALDTEKPFDVVILDLTIPGGMGGEETIKALREIDPDVKAIVTSGYATEGVMAEYKAYGFIGFLSKPFNLKLLRSSLDAV